MISKHVHLSGLTVDATGGHHDYRNIRRTLLSKIFTDYGGGRILTLPMHLQETDSEKRFEPMCFSLATLVGPNLSVTQIFRDLD